MPTRRYTGFCKRFPQQEMASLRSAATQSLVQRPCWHMFSTRIRFSRNGCLTNISISLRWTFFLECVEVESQCKRTGGEPSWHRHSCRCSLPSGWTLGHRQECLCHTIPILLALVFLLALCTSSPASAQAPALSQLAQNRPGPEPPASAADGLAIQNDIPSLQQVFSGYFTVGAAIWAGDISGPHSELLKKHFNSITAENVMKWAVIEPAEGNFNFAPADALVGFAKSNHMLIRGHTLCWHKQVPPWLFKDPSGNPMTPTPENKALLLRRLENHIRGGVSHYKDDVYAWDVVNEVIDPEEPD